LWSDEKKWEQVGQDRNEYGMTEKGKSKMVPFS